MNFFGINEIQTKHETIYLLNKNHGFSKEQKPNFP